MARSAGVPGNRGGDKTASMSSAMSAIIDTASLAPLGDVVTTGKGAKQIPLSTLSGEAVIWTPNFNARLDLANLAHLVSNL